MNTINVSNMTSARGNVVPNQFIIRATEGTYFQSYSSIIAFIPSYSEKAEGAKIVLDATYWNYSRTTAKYRNEFLGETTKETERKLKAGIYELGDLNA